MALGYTSTYQAHGEWSLFIFNTLYNANHLESALASVWLATTMCCVKVMYSIKKTVYTTYVQQGSRIAKSER